MKRVYDCTETIKAHEDALAEMSQISGMSSKELHERLLEIGMGPVNAAFGAALDKARKNNVK